MVQELTAGYELTAEETAAALKEAQDKKKRILDHEAEMERRRQWEIRMQTPFTSKELALYVEWRAKRKGLKFDLDEHNEEVFKQLCQYFTDNPAFEKDGLSLKKGIMLCGPVGTGKTTMMSLFTGNQKQSFTVISCRKMADQFKTGGEELLHIWSRPLSTPSSADNFYQKQLGTCFDDLGTEGIKKNFGDTVNVMQDLILNRYDNSSTPHYFTHLTTNLTAEEIGEFYGKRARSRMREMFNLITLSGEDRRV